MSISDPKQVTNQRISALHVSSVAALVVHSVDQTGAYVSPGAGSTQVSIKEILSSSGGSLIDSSNVSLGVTIRAGSAAGTEYTDGDVDLTPNGGAIFFDNSSNTMRVVSAANPLPVSGTFSASTIVTVSALPLISSAAPAGNSSALIVRIAGGPSSAVDAKFAIGAIRDSGGSELLDSTLHAVRVTAHDGGAVPVNVSNPIAAGTNLIGQFNIATPLSSAAANSNSSAVIVRVAGGVSSAADFPVRALLSSTKADNLVTVYQSSRAEFLNTVYQSSASELLMTATIGTNLQSSAVPAAGSSGLNVWMVGGNRLNIGSTAADNAVTATIGTNLQSSAAPAAGSSGLNVWVVGGNRLNIGSTAADNAVTATIGTNLQSTSAPSSGSSGIVVRPVLENLLTAASSNAFASTTLVVSQNVAGQRCKVFAYSITSTVQTPTTLKFYGGSTMVWPVILAAISSAVTGANLAVDPPGYLFASDANSSLSIRTASSVAGFKVGISYFMAP